MSISPESAVYGTWKYTGSFHHEAVRNNIAEYSTWACPSANAHQQLQGITFDLTEAGDVVWDMRGIGSLGMAPFIGFEHFEIVPGPDYNNDTRIHSFRQMGIKLNFFGTQSGQIVELTGLVVDDMLTIVFENCCTLECVKVKSNEEAVLDPPFSLSDALANGYWADFRFVSDNGAEFHAHKLILETFLPNSDFAKLNGLSFGVLKILLYYAYTEALPSDMSLDEARLFLDETSDLEITPQILPLRQACEVFLRCSGIKQQMIKLLEDVSTTAERIRSNVVGRNLSDCTAFSFNHFVFSSPARVVQMLKLVLRDFAVGLGYAVQFCDAYVAQHMQLSSEESMEILLRCKEVCPYVLTQLKQAFQSLAANLSYLSVEQRTELARYLLSEVDHGFETAINLLAELKILLNHIISAIQPPSSAEILEDGPILPGAGVSQKRSFASVLKAMKPTMLSLNYALHMKELISLNRLAEQVSDELVGLLMKRDSFLRMNEDEKVRFVRMCIGQIAELDEADVSLRADVAISYLKDELSLKQWKYLFKLLAAKVEYGLNKLRPVSDSPSLLNISIRRFLELVNSETFTNSVVALGLYPASELTKDIPTDELLEQCRLTHPEKEQLDVRPPDVPSRIEPINASKQTVSCENRCLTKPEAASKSTLAKRIHELFESKVGSDIDLLILPLPAQQPNELQPEGLATHSLQDDKPKTSAIEPGNQAIRVKAHSVILAARCPWFKRLLLSGMQESHNREITIHEDEPDLFCVFLEYLYSGVLKHAAMSVDELICMLQLADKYEMDCLKHICEQSLVPLIDSSNAHILALLVGQIPLPLLSAAVDRYAVLNPDLETARYPITEPAPWLENIRRSLHDDIAHLQTAQSISSNFDGFQSQLSGRLTSTAPPASDCVVDMGDFSACGEFNDIWSADDDGICLTQPMSSGHSADEIEQLVLQLKGVLGSFANPPEANEHQANDAAPEPAELSEANLRTILEAADFDLNRAINFALDGSLFPQK